MKTLLPKQQTWGRSKHVRRDERFLSLAQIDKLYHELKKHCNVCGNEFGNFQVVHPIHFWNRIYCTHAHVNEELSGMFTQKKKNSITQVRSSDCFLRDHLAFHHWVRTVNTETNV